MGDPSSGSAQCLGHAAVFPRDLVFLHPGKGMLDPGTDTARGRTDGSGLSWLETARRGPPLELLIPAG